MSKAAKNWALDPHELARLGDWSGTRMEGPWRLLGCPGCGERHYNNEECPALKIVPISLREANEWVREHHRHHGPTQGHKFSVGLRFGDDLVGVAIAGLPVGRHDNDGLTIEVRRVATLGTRNGCSKLYGAVAKAAKGMGYERVLTFTLPEEGGGSLRAAGFELKGKTSGGSWDTPSRRREDKGPLGRKFRWERALAGGEGL